MPVAGQEILSYVMGENAHGKFKIVNVTRRDQ